VRCPAKCLPCPWPRTYAITQRIYKYTALSPTLCRPQLRGPLCKMETAPLRVDRPPRKCMISWGEGDNATSYVPPDHLPSLFNMMCMCVPLSYEGHPTALSSIHHSASGYPGVACGCGAIAAEGTRGRAERFPKGASAARRVLVRLAQCQRNHLTQGTDRTSETCQQRKKSVVRYPKTSAGHCI
jgi:hypothetical protein